MATALQKIRWDGISAYKASKLYGIPQSTLKDRISGNISDDTLKSGPQPLFSMEEESRLADHLKFMASLGYGYSRTEVVDIASQYAIECGKRSKENMLSLQWYRSFQERWPRLDLLKPRSLSFNRAKAASQENINKYFTELETILKKYDLQDKPHCIYNIDEKGISHEHIPPFVVAEKGTQPPAITSERSTNVTVIGCGNAMGTQIPPFIVFQGARMRSELLDGCTPGTDGAVSLTGWSNGEIFKQYLKEHFMKYVQGLSADQPIMVLYDGHKSHVSLELIDWARQNNIILFVLPAHTSHLLQPLDVGCFRPYSTAVNFAMHKYVKATKQRITRYNIGQIAAKSYTQTMSAENLKSAFRKTVIYPFDSKVIPPEKLLPATTLKTVNGPSTTDMVNDHTLDATDDDVLVTASGDGALVNTGDGAVVTTGDGALVTTGDGAVVTTGDGVFVTASGDGSLVAPTGEDDVAEIFNDSQNDTNNEDTCAIISFLNNKESQVVKVSSKKSKKRNVLSNVVSGKAITETNVMNDVRKHVENQNKKKSVKVNNKRKSSENKENRGVSKSKKALLKQASPKPGPSGLQKIIVSDSDDDVVSDNDSNEDKCCVCNKSSPSELRNCTSLVIVKWGQCMFQSCKHWTHLRFCCDVNDLRRQSVFYCPCHSLPCLQG